MYIHTYTLMYYVYIHVSLSLSIYIYIYIHKNNSYIHIYYNMCICVYTYIYIHIYIYIYYGLGNRVHVAAHDAGSHGRALVLASRRYVLVCTCGSPTLFLRGLFRHPTSLSRTLAPHTLPGTSTQRLQKSLGIATSMYVCTTARPLYSCVRVRMRRYACMFVCLSVLVSVCTEVCMCMGASVFVRVLLHTVTYCRAM